ncbi:MAG TPA: hypothetical protein VFH71_04370 [Rhodanobacteraceae bacterium]|nr:hypothetical protein [Rhodanobacteraceae bacterium]
MKLRNPILRALVPCAPVAALALAFSPAAQAQYSYPGSSGSSSNGSYPGSGSASTDAKRHEIHSQNSSGGPGAAGNGSPGYGSAGGGQPPSNSADAKRHETHSHQSGGSHGGHEQPPSPASSGSHPWGG